MSSLTKIIITGNKEGTGKTIIAALHKKVNLIDTDPNQAFKFWSIQAPFLKKKEDVR